MCERVCRDVYTRAACGPRAPGHAVRPCAAQSASGCSACGVCTRQRPPTRAAVRRGAPRRPLCSERPMFAQQASLPPRIAHLHLRLPRECARSPVVPVRGFCTRCASPVNVGAPVTSRPRVTRPCAGFQPRWSRVAILRTHRCPARRSRDCGSACTTAAGGGSRAHLRVVPAILRKRLCEVRRPCVLSRAHGSWHRPARRWGHRVAAEQLSARDRDAPRVAAQVCPRKPRDPEHLMGARSFTPHQ